jgi:hypothetical protein
LEPVALSLIHYLKYIQTWALLMSDNGVAMFFIVMCISKITRVFT